MNPNDLFKPAVAIILWPIVILFCILCAAIPAIRD